MNVLVIYEDPQDAVQRGRLIAEVISSNLCKKGLNVTLVDYNNLSSSSIKSYRRRNQNVIKEVDVELLNDIYKSDSLLFISSNILYQDQIPSELKQVTKLSNKSKTFNSHRWTISGLSCFIIRNSSKNIEMAKTIWSTFRYVEVSSSLYDYYRPSYTEILNVEETPCPSV